MDVAALCTVPVGVVLWHEPEPAVTVVVKATFALDRDGEALLAPVQEPLGLDEPSPEPDAAEPHAASDFAPLKTRADVLVVGQAHGPAAAAILPARLRVDNLERHFTAVASQPAAALPLVSRYLRHVGAPDGEPLHVGPRPAPLGPWWGHPADQPFDFSVFNVAPRAQQVDQLRASATLQLENLLAGTALREVRLPGVRPVCFYLPSRNVPPSSDGSPQVALDVQLRCDTLWIDTDRAICTLSWRGVLVLPREHDASEHLVVALQTTGASRSWADVSTELPSARWLRAVEAPMTLVPPCWVRASPSARSMPATHVPRAVAPKPRSPRRPEAVTGLFSRALGAPEPLPFVSRGAPAVPPPSPVEPAPASSSGSTAVIDRAALLQSRALPFDSTHGAPNRSVEQLAKPVGGASAAADAHHRRAGGAGRQTMMLEASAEPQKKALPFTSAIVSESLTATGEAAPTVPATRETSGRKRGTGTLSLEAVSPAASGAAAWPAPPVPGEVAATVLSPSPPPSPFIPRPPAPLSRPQPGGAPAPDSPPPVASSEGAGERPSDAQSGNTIALETYAKVKTELWKRPGAMAEILERHDVSEALWHANERRQEQELAEEARAGRHELAARLRRALGAARAEGTADDTPALTLEEYVQLRVEVDCAEDAASALDAKGLSAEQWHRLRRHWHERSLADPALARKLRSSLAAIRQARRAGA